MNSYVVQLGMRADATPELCTSVMREPGGRYSAEGYDGPFGQMKRNSGRRLRCLNDCKTPRSGHVLVLRLVMTTVRQSSFESYCLKLRTVESRIPETTARRSSKFLK